MLVYPKNFESKIGFDTIRTILKEKCLSEIGRKYVDKLHFTDNYDLINKLLSQTEELRQVLLFEGSIPEEDYFDLTKELSRITIEGTFIETEALFNLKVSLATISECISFIKKLSNEKYPHLKELIRTIVLDKEILKRIDHIIDEKGKIKDTASSELQKIRKDLISKQLSVEKKVIFFVNSYRKQGLIPENEMPTVRNGRTVIPVLAANKRKVKGIIQDESATGQTVFIEPDEVIEINNEIRELEYEERREIIRILIEFSAFLRPHIEELLNCYRFLGMFDFIRAKTRFAIETESIKPHLFKETMINWSKAKHPLLLLSHKKRHKAQDTSIKTQKLKEGELPTIKEQQSTNKDVVPNDIYLDKKKRILIISGPNAGGKSVCLKTAGLLQYMLQCGLLVSMAEHSDAGIFAKLFIDIGDEQSIENDLSTYSSHLINLKYFIANSDSKTLFFIDELGAGTEPQLGGAIAEASLEEINKKKAWGIVTTHYTNLKLLADKTEGLINGSMMFDTKKLQPTYKLKTGIMGSSYAFEIAKKIGFQKEVLKNAEEKTGTKQVKFEKQLLDLESKKRDVEVKEKEFKAADEILAEYIEKYKKLSEELEKAKKTIINEAKEKADEIVKGSNKLIEKTIKDIKEAQADKEKTKKLREEIKDFSKKLDIKDTTIKPQNKRPQPKVNIPQDKLKTKIEKYKAKTEAGIQSHSTKPKANTPKQEILNPLHPGDYVRAKGKTAVGEVMNVYENDVLVAFSSFNMNIPFKDLEIVNNSGSRTKSAASRSKSNIDINEKTNNFKSTIDVRGMRADEALSDIGKYIDDAILIKIKNINIIHGKGNGILRQVIREYLRTVDEIKEFKDEPAERGGEGVTSITFK